MYVRRWFSIRFSGGSARAATDESIYRASPIMLHSSCARSVCSLLLSLAPVVILITGRSECREDPMAEPRPNRR